MSTPGQLRRRAAASDITAETASSGRRRRAERAALVGGRPCELCGVPYAPAGPVSVAAIVDHLEFTCPRSPIGRRLGRLAPITESELRAIGGDR